MPSEDHIMLPTVVGLDHDTYGWHSVRFEPEPHLRATRFTSRDPDERRHEACSTMRSFFLSLPAGSFVFAEEPIAPRQGQRVNGKTTRLLTLMAGALWAQHLGLSIYWAWVDNIHWKRVVCGNARATKAEIREWALGLPVVRQRMDAYEANPNLYDAHCLAMYGLRAVAGMSSPRHATGINT